VRSGEAHRVRRQALARVVAEAAGRTIDSALADEIDRRAGEIYSELNTDPKPLPGARELLQALNDMGLPWRSRPRAGLNKWESRSNR